MSDPLFVLDPLPDTEHVLLDGVEGHHAAAVRRIEVGEWVTLADGRGLWRRGQVTVVGRGEAWLRCEPIEVAPIPSRRIIAVQALPKGDRAELAVELLTELGVDEIVPWSASRSIVQWDGERGAKALEKWRRTAREAGKQSRRPRFPEVGPVATTRAVARLVAGAGRALVLHEDADHGLAGTGLGVEGDVIVIIGPEGGVSPHELTTFVDAGARAVRLGDPVLRTSTAGGAALAVLSARLGRWG